VLNRALKICSFVAPSIFVARCYGRVAREEMFNVGQRPDVDDILVVITDGMFDDPNATWIEAMKTRANNISIIAVSTSILGRPELIHTHFFVNNVTACGQRGLPTGSPLEIAPHPSVRRLILTDK